MMSLLRHTIVILLFELSQSVSVPLLPKYIPEMLVFFNFIGKSLELLNQMWWHHHDITRPNYKLIPQLCRAYATLTQVPHVLGEKSESYGGGGGWINSPPPGCETSIKPRLYRVKQVADTNTLNKGLLKLPHIAQQWVKVWYALCFCCS